MLHWLNVNKIKHLLCTSFNVTKKLSFILLTFSQSAKHRFTPLHCHVNWQYQYSLRQAYSRRCTSLQIQVERISRMPPVLYLLLASYNLVGEEKLCAHCMSRRDVWLTLHLYAVHCVCSLIIIFWSHCTIGPSTYGYLFLLSSQTWKPAFLDSW